MPLGKIVLSDEQRKKRGKLTLKKPKIDIKPVAIEEPAKEPTTQSKQPADKPKKEAQSPRVDNPNTFQASNKLNIPSVPDGHFTVLTEFCRLIDDKILGASYVLVFNSNILKLLGFKFCELIDQKELPGRPFKKIYENSVNSKRKFRANLYKNELKPHFEAMVIEWLVSRDAETFFRNSKSKSTKAAANIIKKLAKFANDENKEVPAKYSIVESEYRLKNAES